MLLNKTEKNNLYGKYFPTNLSSIYFAAKNRHSFVARKNKEELNKYMTASVANRKAKMLAIYCMSDNAHIFVGFKPFILISDFIREIKVESNEFVNDKKWRKKIRLAGGIWCFFLFSFTYRQGCKTCV